MRTALMAVGGRWKPLIMLYLLKEPHTFGDLRRACDDVANKTLATQLREMERDGLITRTVNGDARRSVTYAPTEDGQEIAPVIRSLVTWGNRRLEQARAARVALAGE